MLVSIIMPIYNSEKYLDASVNSILNQTFQDFELILLDDGSLDNSWMKCKEFAAQDSRVKIIHIENQGVSAARNIGIHKSSGKYIRFVDADDVVPEDSLEKMILPMLQDERIDLVIGKFDTDGRELYLENKEGLYPVADMIDQYLLYIPSFYYGVVWNKLYKAEIIKSTQLQFNVDVFWSEDLLFNLEYYKNCQQIYYLTEQIYHYCYHASSLLSQAEEFEIEKMFEMEIVRFTAVYDLVCLKNRKKDALNQVYEYLMNVINNTLSKVLDIQETSLSEKYRLFAGLLEKHNVSGLLGREDFENKNWIYKINNILIKRKKNILLFLFFQCKHSVMKNKMVNNWIRKRDRRSKFVL